jgi:MFS transporter, DHA1 family, tetracycline resistance protein
MKHANVSQILWLYLTGTIAFSLMEQVLGLFIEHTWLPDGGGNGDASHLRHAAALTATFMIVVGVASTAVQGVLVGKLAKRFGERRLLIGGVGTLAVAMSIMPTVRTYAQFVAIGPLVALGAGLMFPSLASLLSRAVASDTVGGSLGIGQSLAALGRVLGPTIAGVLFEFAAWAPFAVASVLNVTCVLVALTLREDEPHA